jgi:MoaA/NifB/PqqE/SkfB family radical SAM enzyme
MSSNRQSEPVRLLAWVDYQSPQAPQALLAALSEVKTFVVDGTASIAFHCDAEQDVVETRRRLEEARKTAKIDVAALVTCLDARAADAPTFDGLLWLDRALPEAQAALCQHLELPHLSNRYEVEELCIERGLVPRVLERAFCTKPWQHLHIEADGVAMPCCNAYVEAKTPSLADQPLPEVYNSQAMRRVRLSMLRGVRDPLCRDCWDREDRGECSARSTLEPAAFAEAVTAARSITTAEGAIPADKIAPDDIDIRWSNLCNFKCRMCWHRSSSAWFDDAEKIAEEIDATSGRAPLRPEDSARRFLVWGEKPVVSFNADGRALDKLGPYLKNVRHVYSVGGEPLMMDEHFEFLEHLRPRASEITLKYDTNLSKLAHRGRDIFEIWKPFAEVHLGLSVDGLGPVGEYVRTGFKTERWIQNLHRIQEEAQKNSRLSYGIKTTVSSYNLFHIPDFIREALARGYIDSARQIAIQIVRVPTHASPLALPKTLRERAAELYQGLAHDLRPDSAAAAKLIEDNIVSPLRAAEDALFEINRTEVWTDMQRLDRLRGTSWRDVTPHMGCFEPGGAAR